MGACIPFSFLYMRFSVTSSACCNFLGWVYLMGVWLLVSSKAAPGVFSLRVVACGDVLCEWLGRTCTVNFWAHACSGMCVVRVLQPRTCGFCLRGLLVSKKNEILCLVHTFFIDKVVTALELLHLAGSASAVMYVQACLLVGVAVCGFKSLFA